MRALVALLPFVLCLFSSVAHADPPISLDLPRSYRPHVDPIDRSPAKTPLIVVGGVATGVGAVTTVVAFLASVADGIGTGMSGCHDPGAHCEARSSSPHTVLYVGIGTTFVGLGLLLAGVAMK